MSIKNGVKGRDSRLNELYSARSKGLTKKKEIREFHWKVGNSNHSISGTRKIPSKNVQGIPRDRRG